MSRGCHKPGAVVVKEAQQSSTCIATYAYVPADSGGTKARPLPRIQRRGRTLYRQNIVNSSLPVGWGAKQGTEEGGAAVETLRRPLRQVSPLG